MVCPPVKEFKIEFNRTDGYNAFLKENYNVIRLQGQYNQVTIRIDSDKTADLLQTLKDYDVKFISELPYTLEKHFKNILIKEKKELNGNVQ